MKEAAATTELLESINKATKWGVSAVVFGTLLWRHDARACWCVLGSICAAANCKLLKWLVNETRPPGARKADPGMPSSHAQSLAFLSTYTAAEIFDIGGPSVALAAALLGGGAFLSWLRIRLGYHTVPQVLVGHALGLNSALLWRWFGQAYILDYFLDSRALVGLYCATGAFVTVFALIMVRNLWKEERST
eukprot:TRINITY_DN22507_c0_g1_i1.p1 TRINITY_DN22507_c0_g1~~TRINITY_DN22507_c0_g1_i1.p1  ORF type:complete len:191 (-),score=27.52 TRINITY_DN22507_c0_g1_i1:366-938(-)